MADWSVVVKDMVVAGAAATGAVVAVLGLGTWRRQLRGGVEYELARRVLRATYRLREAFKHVRNPTMWGTEMPSPPAEDGMTPESARYYGLARAYEARWSKVREAHTALEAEQLEAEAVWGKELQQLLRPLRELQAELFSVVHLHLGASNPNATATMQETLWKLQREKRDILYLVSEDDEFSVDVSKALRPIEEYLKQHLRR